MHWLIKWGSPLEGRTEPRAWTRSGSRKESEIIRVPKGETSGNSEIKNNFALQGMNLEIPYGKSCCITQKKM